MSIFRCIGLHRTDNDYGKSYGAQCGHGLEKILLQTEKNRGKRFWEVKIYLAKLELKKAIMDRNKEFPLDRGRTGRQKKLLNKWKDTSTKWKQGWRNNLKTVLIHRWPNWNKNKCLQVHNDCTVHDWCCSTHFDILLHNFL